MNLESYKDRFPDSYYYGVFCMVDIAKAYLAIDPYDANDDAWDKGIELYDAFFNSKYNLDDRSEIDCMDEFLKQKTNKIL
jgi:hypothetical protein